MATKNNPYLKRGFKAYAERVSEDIRKELNVSKYYPLDAFKLADHFGLPVWHVDEVLPKEQSVKLIGTKSDPKDFSAILIPHSEYKKAIIHNPLHSPNRQQSNLMHELSHYICKHEIPDEIKDINIPMNLRYYNPFHEEEAKYLGGCLQIPKPGLLWKLKEECSEEEISDFFSASIDMVKYRINVLGIRKWKAKK